MSNSNSRDVAHELKGELTRLQSYMYMASMSYAQGKTDEAKEYVKQHDQTIQAMSALIDQSFSKSE